jgi:predicted cupin superfamily sugar epimerase
MTAEEVKTLLQLEPLPVEGGFFRETYRSRCELSPACLPEGFSGSRSLATAIYYLITPESFSALHRVPGEEIFHFYCGDPVRMLQLLPDGTSRTITLGIDLVNGHQPQVIVEGGIWQGCRLIPDGSWALLGTTMSPGFDPGDYETGERARLIAEYPGAAASIRDYTREP